VGKIEPAPEDLAATMLVETTEEGWGETGLSRLEEGVKKDPQDTPGPVPIAYAVGAADEKKETERSPRLVVVGNSRFVANGSLGNAANANLFLNAVHWLAGAEKRIGIAPKTPEQASLSLTEAQVRRIGLFSVFGLPGLAVLLGVWVWYRRRD
jgi:ABC-type uncharacterized transport system involved in gliding motility auxiliary subunit